MLDRTIEGSPSKPWSKRWCSYIASFKFTRSLFDDTENLDQLKQMGQYLANAYINAMGYCYEEIEPFYKVVKNIRIYELNSDKLECPWILTKLQTK